MCPPPLPSLCLADSASAWGRALRSKRALSALVFALGCSPAEGDVLSLRPALEPKTASPADAFADSMGIDIRLGWGDTAYTERFDDLVIPALTRLRARHVRDDSAKALTEPENVGVTSELLSRLPATGLYSTMIMDPRLNLPAAQALDIVALAGGAVEAVEGPTTSNYAGTSLTDQQVRDYMSELAESAGTTLPLVAAAANGASVGRQDAWVDYGHVVLRLTDLPTSEALTAAVSEATANSPGRPLVATMPGYQTTPSDVRPHVPELVAAKYLLRAWAGNFEQRVVRTYLSPLLDLSLEEDPEHTSQRGLLRSDGSEKPAFAAMVRLSELLADPGVTYLPGALAYEVHGRQASLHEILLSSRNGRFYLLLWQEAHSFDAVNDTEIVVAPLEVELELGAEHDLKLFSPLLGDQANQEVRAARRIALRVEDHPLVVVVEP